VVVAQCMIVTRVVRLCYSVWYLLGECTLLRCENDVIVDPAYRVPSGKASRLSVLVLAVIRLGGSTRPGGLWAWC